MSRRTDECRRLAETRNDPEMKVYLMRLGRHAGWQSAAAAEERVLERERQTRRLTVRQPCGVTFAVRRSFPERNSRRGRGENQLRACARILLVAVHLSVSFGLTGCTAIDEVTIPTKAEVLLLRTRVEPVRLIPPAEIPKRSAKAPRTDQGG